MTEWIRFHDSTDALCSYVASNTGDTCLLSFSCGKDAIASWIVLRRHFARVIPFYMYPVPGLEFVESSLRYYEDRFKTEIIRLPHPSFYRQLCNFVFQPPGHCEAIETTPLPLVTYSEIDDYLRERFELPYETLTALGTRCVDSPLRRASYQRFGCLNPTRRGFWPIFNWYTRDVVKLLCEERMELPIDYYWFGRTFDGLDYRFLEPIKRHAPKDYARILEWFPLAELELMRRNLRTLKGPPK